MALGELALRTLLFSESPTWAKLGQSLRVPGRFSCYNTPENWKLRVLFAKERRAQRSARRKHPHYHPILGTRRKTISLDYHHDSEPRLAGRRPILLFGDSFGQCVAAIDKCWEDLLEETELAREHYLLNYAVGGYGFDQISLLLEHTLPLYIEENPIVIVSLLVDDDIDRCYLPMRTYPKPFFTIGREREGEGGHGDGEVVYHAAPHLTPLDFIAANPPAIRSYLWRYILFGLPNISGHTLHSWSGHGDHVEQKKRIALYLLDKDISLLEGAGVDYFFFLFHGPVAAREDVHDWEDGFLREYFRARDVPFIASDEYLRKAQQEEGAELLDYFFTEGTALSHYNDRGNRVVFEGILSGLRGEF